jgi:glycyl-tRNA synthetase beta chain
MSLSFLLEIGTEEIPDWMIPGALENLKSLFAELLATHNLAHANLRVDGTVRRLVLRAEDLPERQADSEQTVLGPAANAPTAAIAGFAKKQGVAVEDLAVQPGGKLGYIRKISGRATKDILSESLPSLILKIYFPKTMYWAGKNGPRFIRPIRWLVALLGDDVVPFEIAGVRSGNVSSGHRRLGVAQVAVSISSYEQKLKDNFVILSAAERRQKIHTETYPLMVRHDPELVETHVYLNEYPTAISGQFDPQFLALPEEVLVTVMKHHQKYFAVDFNGLRPQFVAIMNTSSDPDGFVKRGNERVLRARFNDARFFWDTDQKKKLADRVADLEHVTFQKQLGSYLAKADRMVELVKQLGGDEDAQRAARLCKCDLTTELVKEFTELQGVVGGRYAEAQGENAEVADAIYDHYKPVSMEDSIPRTPAGRIVSLADKLDTLRGCFGIGMMPTGSKDPFALRRAAQGVVKILVEGGLELAVSQLARSAELTEFFRDRVVYYFKDIRGCAYDEVNAGMSAGWDNLVDLAKRLEALKAVRPTPNFEPLAASFKRIQNILKQAQFTEPTAVEARLLEPGPEFALFTEFERAKKESAGQPFRQALETIASLRPSVDLFFDKVLVNATDPAVRQNRLSLLANILREFSTIADFSEIVTAAPDRT